MLVDKNPKIHVDSATAEERDFIDDKIIEFNATQVPFSQNEKFIHIDYVAKNNDTVIGGITAVLYCWKCLYIDVLWVDEKYRNQMIGSQLLSAVEKHAQANGCHLAHLDTFDFQAKDFYMKYGYEIFGELNDCPPGHTRFYMKKNLL